MDKNDEKRQQLLVRMMTSGGDRSRPRRDYLLEPWRRIARHLSPLIGESGISALLGRASKLVEPQFDWLAGGSSAKSINVLLEGLGDSFDQNADAAQAGNAALLDTFTKLLADLIGEALTIRLLQTAVDGPAEQKNAQEQK
ncbi:MAG: hypothetical protein ACXWC4_17775 [Telluria sp.]